MAASSTSIATRWSTEQLAFGQPAQLPMHVLPTELDIAKIFLHEKQKWITETSTIKEQDCIVLYCIVLYSSIYIAPLSSHRQTEALLVQLAPRKETSFKK